MGVKACDRPNCESVMCDRCILNNTKYICGDCWQELCEWRETWAEEMEQRQVKNLIVEFMDSEKGSFKVRVLDSYQINQEFNKLMGIKDEVSKEW